MEMVYISLLLTVLGLLMWNWWYPPLVFFRERQVRQLVFVASAAIDIPGEYMKGWIVFDMTSWTLEQYKKACENNIFYNTIKANFTDENSKEEKSEEVLKKELIELSSCLLVILCGGFSGRV